MKCFTFLIFLAVILNSDAARFKDGCSPHCDRGIILKSRNKFVTKSEDILVFAKADNEDAKKKNLTNAQDEIKSARPFRPSSMPKINSLMFIFYATMGSAMPFLPIYYKRIGLSDSVVGFLGAITPAVTFIVSPLWGALADKTGRHKEIMMLTFLGSVIARYGLVFDKLPVVWLSIIVAISAVLNAPVKPLMDSTVMSMLVDKSYYGRSRLFGQLGFGFGSYIVSSLIQQNIKGIFAVQAALAIPSTLLMMSFRPSKESIKPKEQSMTDITGAIRHILNDKGIILFFTLVFIIGVSSGIIENFAYVRIAEVGGPTGRVLGIYRLISSIAGGPMFWLSGQIASKIGVNGILLLSLTSYVLRFFNYGLIQNPWQALPAEILRGLTFATFWAGSTYHVYNASPKGLTATMLGLLNGIYGGLGQSVGALIGGHLSKRLGISNAFLMCGLVDVSILSVFGLYLYLEWKFMKSPARVQESAAIEPIETGETASAL